MSKAGDTMTGTLVLNGSPAWKAPGTAAGLQPSGDTTGVTDTANITGLLTFAGAGGECKLAPGVFHTLSPVVVPNWTALTGSGCAVNNSLLADVVTTIKPVAAFASSVPLPGGGGNVTAAVVMTGSPSANGGGQLITNLHIDGSASPASTDGIAAAGWVYGTRIRDVSVAHATGIGLNLINSGGAGSQPDGWRIQGLMCAQGAGDGVFMQAADMIADDVHSIGNAGAGFQIKNAASSLFNRCRAADNGGSGFLIPNNNTEWLLFNGCMTDANGNAGYNISGSGGQTIQLTGCSSSGDTNAGVILAGNSARTVLIDNLAVTSGGTPPAYGIQLTGTNYYVSVTSAFLQAATPISGTIDSYRNITTLAGGTLAKLADSDIGLRPSNFGDGSDGAVILDGSTSYGTFASLAGSTYTLTDDVLATTLVVNSGVTLKTGGYRVFAQVSITNAGTISNAGNAASGSTAGTAGTSGTLRSGTGGGSAGTGVSGAGGSSTALTGVGSAAGGNGGAGTSGAAGSAGALTGNAHARILRTLPPGVSSGAYNAANFQVGGGTGGGGGGSDASSNAGGAGGAAGGAVQLSSPAVTNTGTITAAGGNGGNAAGGNAGGGGGGGGGLILVHSTTAWAAGTTSVAGGTGGAKAGTGANGSNGGNGTVLNVVIA